MSVKALVIDFSRVLVFANADVSSLNRHHAALQAQAGYRVLEHFRINHELLDYLRQLSGRVPVYIFSDGRLHTLPEIAPALEGIFDKIVTAEEIGHKKSDPAAFVALASRLGYAPADLLFVDDQDRNVQAAQAAGFAAYQYIGNPELIDYLNRTPLPKKRD